MPRTLLCRKGYENYENYKCEREVMFLYYIARQPFSTERSTQSPSDTI